MRHWVLAGIAATTVALANCSDSIAPETLIGTWDATELRFTNLANSSQSIEIIGLGGNFVITLSVGGTYGATLTAPGVPADVTTGTWVYTDLDGLTLTETGGDATDINVSLSGNTMTISSTDGITFDFGAGEVSARLDGTLVRR